MRTNGQADMGEKSHKSAGMLRAIGAFKLLKAALLIALGVGAFRLLHKDVAQTAEGWARSLRVDPDNHLLRWCLARLSDATDGRLRLVAICTFCYAALFGTEGVGLILCRRWAEWMTVVTTGLLMPLEIYELVKHVTAVRIAALVVNAAVVVYLILRLRWDRPQRKAPKGEVDPLRL